MTGVNNINPAVTNVKTNKGKKAGAVLGATTGLGVAGSIAYIRKDALAKDVANFVKNCPKDTLTYKIKDKPVLKDISKKTAAIIDRVAIPFGKLALTAAAAGAVIGVVGGAIADKIAAHRSKQA